MQNWFETLSEALKSENIENWPCTTSISYGETVREFIGDRVVVIYRETNGRYERPVHYKALKNKN